MKTKFWSVAVALLALVLCGTAIFSYAQQNDTAAASGWSGHQHGRMGFMARELNLTDAQKQQIKTMMQSQHATMHPLMQQLATIEAYRQDWREKKRMKEEDRQDRDENTFRKLKQRLKAHE